MSSRINLPALPTWTTLGDSERHHAGMLARRLEDSGHVSAWRPGCASQIHFAYSPVFSGAEQIKWYAHDALLCALTHGEALIALRALLQAAGYIARLDAAREHHWLHDASRAAQSRVETMIRQGDRAIARMEAAS